MRERSPLMPFQKDILEALRKGDVKIHTGAPPRRMGKSYFHQTINEVFSKGKDETVFCPLLDSKEKKQ